MPVNIRMLVLDVLKPHKPNIIDFSKRVAEVKGILTADINVEEVDEKTESVKLIVEGTNIDYESLEDLIKELGGSVHSIDRVRASRKPKG